MTMALSDRGKLYLLAGSLLFCLLTTFTSSGLQMGSRDLPILRPSNKNCREPQQALRKCEKEGGQCSQQAQLAGQCDKAVNKAYRYINTRGCSFQNQAVVLCETEWCGVGTGGGGDCQKECKQARKELEECTKAAVDWYLQRVVLSPADTKSVQAR